MNRFNFPGSRQHVADSLLVLARCSKRDRIIIAGQNAPELMFALHQRGFRQAVTTSLCGLPHGQYDCAIVDWEAHSLKSLEPTLDWLRHFLASSAVLVIRADLHERGALRKIRTMLTRLDLAVEGAGRSPHRLVISARQADAVKINAAA
jgi:hypothetical protein